MTSKNPEPAPMNRMLRWFDFSHLPDDLWVVAQLIRDTALELNDEIPESAEKTAGLRKLLEAKDCFVRATIEARKG